MSPFDAPVKPLALGTAEVVGKSLNKQQFIALIHTALESGITVFDTASNYQDGRAQKWLRDAFTSYCGSTTTCCCYDNLLIVTKIGQLSNTEWKRRRLNDVTAPHYDFSIPFLERQLYSASAAFEGLGKLLVLLHNPEDDTRFKDSGDLEFIARTLESWAERGHFIGWGLSSWTGLLSSEGSPAKFQLTRLLNDGETRRFKFFKAVQVPMGLWNSAQVFFPAQSLCSGDEYADLFEVSQNYGIKVFLNSCFLGGEQVPEYSTDADERKLAPSDVLKLCYDLAPGAIRVLGATRPTTIETSTKIFAM